MFHMVDQAETAVEKKTKTSPKNVQDRTLRQAR